MLLLALAPAALAAPPLDAVVLLRQGASTCAGAFVDADGTVATAYHCVASGGRPLVETRDGKEATGRVISVDVSADLAVVAVPDLAGTPWIPLRIEPPAVGEEVWALGHPYGSRPPGGFLTDTLRWSASSGIVSAVGPVALQISAPVNPGNSGGPVVDGDGRLVGVVSRRLSGDGLGFAARADLLAGAIADPDPMGPIGGTVALGLYSTVWGGEQGTIAGGGRLELAARDRVWADVAMAFPFQGRWDAVRFGEIAWVGAEARLGLRQRLFRGPFTTRIDVYGGAFQVQSLEGEPDLSLRPGRATGLGYGGGVSMPGFGLGADVAWVTAGGVGAPRWMLQLTWPGVIWIW
jgi:hypothetical protein